MQLEKAVTKEPNSKISIRVTVDKSSVGEVRESVIRDYEKSVRMPGFRRGKVPRQIILSRFSDTIKNKTQNLVLSRSLTQVLEEGKYNPISEPAIIEIGDLVPGENFSFTAECDLVPEVTLGEYRGISSLKYIYDVKDAAVDLELEKLRERFSTLVSVDRKAKNGDYIVMDYEELLEDGKQGERKENQTVFLDKKDDPLVKQLAGLGKGEAKDVELALDYEENGKNISKTKRFHVQVKEVKQKELPELNDDFAKDISDAENLEKLKEKIREELKEDAARRSVAKTKDEIITRLISKSTYEIPETLLAHEVDRIIGEIAHAYRTDIEHLRKDQKRYEGYRQNLRPRASEHLRYELTLIEVAKREKIEVDGSEIDEEIMGYAKSQKKDVDEIKAQLEKNGSINSLRYRLRMSKSLDFLYQNARMDEEKHILYTAEEETA